MDNLKSGIIGLRVNFNGDFFYFFCKIIIVLEEKIGNLKCY